MGVDRIRVNILHPDAVFDTGLWTEEVLRARAASYGLTVEQYKTKNVLRVEVSSRDVAELAAEVCGPSFAKTTGAQIPVDGGDGVWHVDYRAEDFRDAVRRIAAAFRSISTYPE